MRAPIGRGTHCVRQFVAGGDGDGTWAAPGQHAVSRASASTHLRISELRLECSPRYAEKRSVRWHASGPPSIVRNLPTGHSDCL